MGKNGHAVDSSTALLITVAFTTAVWVCVTLLTPPVDADTLDAFYAKVRPAGPGWAVVRRRTGAPGSPDSLPNALLGWVAALVAVYAALFGTGAYLYGNLLPAVAYTAIFLAAAATVIRVTSSIWGGLSTPLTGTGTGPVDRAG